MDEHIKSQLEILKQQEKELAFIYRHMATKFKISESEFWVLYVLLVFEGEYSQQDICDIWLLPKQTVNSVVAKLVQKGYVFLEAVSGAGNKKNIRLTRGGINFGESTIMNIYEAEKTALGEMTEEERQDFILLFGKYISLLRKKISVF